MGELRIRKIQEFIKQEVSRIILQELKDPRLGSDEEKKNTLAALAKANGFIRSEVGKRLGIRYSPQIGFKEDQSLDYGMKIEKILHTIDNGE